MMENLTREQAIHEHRKMWNWIAEKLENMGKAQENNEDFEHLDAYDLKVLYCKRIGLYPESYCFCCEYEHQQRTLENYQIHPCWRCPVLWGTEHRKCDTYCEYHQAPSETTTSWWEVKELSRVGKYYKAVIIARRIANLPEKDFNNK